MAKVIPVSLNIRRADESGIIDQSMEGVSLPSVLSISIHLVIPHFGPIVLVVDDGAICRPGTQLIVASKSDVITHRTRFLDLSNTSPDRMGDSFLRVGKVLNLP